MEFCPAGLVEVMERGSWPGAGPTPGRGGDRHQVRLHLRRRSAGDHRGGRLARLPPLRVPGVVAAAGHRPDRPVQLHLGELPAWQAQEVAGTLEELVTEGLIRCYGWSTEDPRRAAAFASGVHCAAIQHPLNVLADAPAMLAACDTSQ
jgi:hypothetical protein